ncbi:hypothetical protein D8B26_004772 [Coccidioides posadasii str. Silveira]|uniref:Uncharacterized protein n=2 Tax=Coccidioides posadasii TaxID=199306 RepID=E9D6M8_COCPS|nr:hypothetical protein CPC735_063000 [Coccidioides posadasii C735 delta SOWgp]EER28427.1 hypothetical protein CPC735_063000 [Coccidioides posadasii C735 delta SOWgp]EFW17900.1 conserved hypothetical protein [Coccidioides posadasii str. Silveira]QVM10109.1 hypothetical protein D8B26_004772 [Coccidioides posadasii str. Silveira]|eukprot:XP_003070572.1 hypothetical protein CPC735_063000 [Coccidioides posadasii C735 delta SOWgp]
MDGKRPVPPDERGSNQDIPPKSEISDSDNNSPAQPAPAGKSLADRIQFSASGLLQNTFLNTRSPSLSDSLASGLSGSLANYGKPGSSQGGPFAGQQSSHGVINDSLRSSGGRSAPSTSAIHSIGGPSLRSESFRSNLTSATTDQENADLLRSFEEQLNREEFLFSPEDNIGKGKGKLIAEDTNPPPLQHFSSSVALESAWSHPSQANPNSHPATETTDGSAVLSLLSDPSFDPLTPSSVPPSPTLAPIPDSTVISPALRTEPLPPVSLLPEIQSLLLLPPEELSSIPTVSEWLDLDVSYTDAVWGGALKTYTEEARREVEERKEKGADPGTGDGGVYGGPAVRRLGMILAHLREKKSPVGT